MPRFRSVSEEEVAELAEWVGLDLGPDEAAAAADRIDALSSLYIGLEEAPDSTTGDGDRLDASPYRPDDEEDPHNAWLARFDLSRGDDGPLSGTRVAVKDNVCVRGVGMTCGSLALEGFVPGDHATVVERLLDAGARLVGKTNMDEFAFGPTSETSAFGPTENPAAAGHVAGGSSSGSAAAVAAGEADLALGSDTGGSVRIPASYCGIVGLKPTDGTVPTYGFAPLARSMDHVGTLARDVETAARGLDVLAGRPAGEGCAAGVGTDPDELTIGVAERPFAEHVSEEVERAVRDAISDLADAGAVVEEVEIPELEFSREAWWGIAPAEFAATYATAGAGLFDRARVEPTLADAMARLREDGGRDLGANPREMLALGAHLIGTHGGRHYVRATNLRAALTEGVDRALSDVDVIAAPATPTTALGIGEFERGVTPPVNWNTHPANLTGHPAISVPCGESEGLPVGLQLVGAWHDERAVVGAAAAYEGL